MATMMSTMTSFSGATVSPRVAAGSFAAARSPLRPRTVVVRAQNDKTPNKPAASIWDILSFSGPAPERINGRLAMVGFVTALGVEAGRGDGLLSQLGSGTGQAWFAYTVVVLSVASLVPLLQGESAEARGAGKIMSANAELWNGRFAMLGLVALAATEVLTGAPFVNL
ncbi:low molecular mass early light-inducible protein HV90, chloroplastic [Brachypodium distachyon]|uniref:Uncharacterized protein n=1 Tax=Brachypodium distachyon TaxID=15368 RepID=I1H352_BRADI|nr:low molecular mass early light-inducible protein HV90, chloroplastic [Brachypodium distachyon]KQK20609.1 hypothetical protein BRADI_1g55600v3 [Brachypodium distachyon]|eukprot:XP_003557500.1 low molecular mass early light-inducible protein HV90, chloroplastic [Brachypodium distachyon]